MVAPAVDAQTSELRNDIKAGLNRPGTFSGKVIHCEHIGKTADELVALWNADHPDDPVT